MPNSSIFTVGGTVQAGGGLYISRKADEDLLRFCREGVFSFVLTARQMGKSSLMIRARDQLAVEGIQSVIIDLTQFGAEVTPEAWYFGIITAIEDTLDLDTDCFDWWDEHAEKTLAHRFTDFFEKVVLQEVDAPVVIFIDEIDTTLNLTFTDDFYAAIRYIYNARAQTPAFQRLSFVLIGVATPSDLISDSKRTPFNIGSRVEVGYFTVEEAMPLTEGFSNLDEAEQVLRWVLDWTHGHPFLTLRLCKEVRDEARSRWTKGEIDQLVEDTYLGERSKENSNLQFVRDMLTRRASDPVAVLQAYRDVRLGRKPVLDDEKSPVISHIKLAGIVQRKAGALQLSNKIYAQVFDRRWIRKNWPESWVKQHAVKLTYSAIGLLILTLVVTIGIQRQAQIVADGLRQDAMDAARVAVQQRAIAEARTLEADSLRQVAEDSAGVAVQQREIAEKRTLEAERSSRAAEDSARVAREQRALAEERRLEAERLSRVAEDSARVAREQRAIAVARLDTLRALRDEIENARLGLSLAIRAKRAEENGDIELGALLAREAYFFNKPEGGFINEVYEALRQTLDAVLSSGLRHDSTSFALTPAHEGGVRAVAYQPQGRWLASADEAGHVRIWDMNDYTVFSDTNLHNDMVRSIAFSPDGLSLATGSHDSTLWLSQFQAKNAPRRFKGASNGSIRALSFTKDGENITTAIDGYPIQSWEAFNSGGIVSNILDSRYNRWAADSIIHGLAYSTDRTLLATVGIDKRVRVWLVEESSEPLAELEEVEGTLHAVTFSPDGLYLAAGGTDHSVYVWELDRWTRRTPLLGHEGPISALAFSPDGTWLASASLDGTVRLWSMNPFGTAPVILEEHNKWVHAIAFSPDGNTLVSGSADRSVRVWHVNVEHLANKVCERVPRSLTQEEWENYVGEDIDYVPEPCP